MKLAKMTKKQKSKMSSKDISIFCEINKDIIEFCKVMSDPTRFQIVSLLRNGALPVWEIAERLKKTTSNISHQLRLLKLHKAVESKRKAKFKIYALDKSFNQILSSIIKS